MPSIESLLADAARLPVADRIQLIDAIWDTLPEESLAPLSDEWIAEIQRRSAEYDSGSHAKPQRRKGEKREDFFLLCALAPLREPFALGWTTRHALLAERTKNELLRSDCERVSNRAC
jgi:putative addiction module component (TIGR02574 family)